MRSTVSGTMTSFKYSVGILSIATILVALVSCQLCQCRRNYDVPHAHQGVLTPYEAGPFQSLDLNQGDEQELESGKPVMKQQQGSDLGGGAICVQDVEAPKSAVWSQILDLDTYKGKVPKVNECKNYVVKQNEDGTTTLKTKMVVGVIPGYAVSFFHNEKDRVSWFVRGILSSTHLQCSFGK
jgi:hypothetical protein